MSKSWMVLIVPEPKDDFVLDVDGSSAEIFMRFTEEPDLEFLSRLAKQRPGKRVYSLLGASTWHGP